MKNLIDCYQKTIEDLIYCWKTYTVFSVNNKIEVFLTDLLTINVGDLIKKDSYIDDSRYFSIESISRHAKVFNAFIKIAEVKLNLSELNDPISIDDAMENINIFTDSICHLETTNADLMEIIANELDTNNVLYDSYDYNPKEIINSLRALITVFNGSSSDYSCVKTRLLTKIAKYEIESQINAIYLIIVLSLISFSRHFTDEIKSISSELLQFFLFLLKNGRLLSWKINEVETSPTKEPDQRTSKDNTTKIQAIYGYGNYDTYCLRFDLSHCGVLYPHFNNVSPGKIKASIIDRGKYNSIIKEKPYFEKVFIEYENQYGIKENALSENSDAKQDIQTLVDSLTHQKAFALEYCEEDIIGFVKVLSYFDRSNVDRIDTEGSYERSWHQLNTIVFSVLLYCCALDDVLLGKYEAEKEVISIIGKLANNYGLYNDSRINSIDDLLFIIENAEEQCRIRK